MLGCVTTGFCNYIRTLGWNEKGQMSAVKAYKNVHSACNGHNSILLLILHSTLNRIHCWLYLTLVCIAVHSVRMLWVILWRKTSTVHLTWYIDACATGVCDNNVCTKSDCNSWMRWEMLCSCHRCLQRCVAEHVIQLAISMFVTEKTQRSFYRWTCRNRHKFIWIQHIKYWASQHVHKL